MRPQKAGTMDDLIIIENKIYEIRGQRVMLDFDLAEMYEIETKNLNKAVRRNSERFPEDFMFRLTNEEANSLAINIRFQNGTLSSKDWFRYAPSPSPSRALPCFPVYSAAREPSRSISTSCVLSSVCDNIFFLILPKKNWKNLGKESNI